MNNYEVRGNVLVESFSMHFHLTIRALDVESAIRKCKQAFATNMIDITAVEVIK